MAVPKYDELMKPLLAAVKDGEVYKIKDAKFISGRPHRNASERQANRV